LGPRRFLFQLPQFLFRGCLKSRLRVPKALRKGE